MMGECEVVIEFWLISSRLLSKSSRRSSGVAMIFGPPRKQLVWAPGEGFTATTSSWRAPGGPLQPRGPPRGRGACGALATPLRRSMYRAYRNRRRDQNSMD